MARARDRAFDPLAAVLGGLIRVYRWGVSPFLLPSCRFAPSCSEYALESLLRFGTLRGGYMAARRILRCHPWGGAGYDPVPGASLSDTPALDGSGRP